MKKVLKLAVSLMVAAAILPGCMSSSAGLAPSTMPLKSSDDYTVLSQEDVSGSSWGVNLLGILPLSEMSTAKSRDRAIRAAGADALIDVTTNNYMYMIPAGPFPIYLYRIQVAGKPIKML